MSWWRPWRPRNRPRYQLPPAEQERHMAELMMIQRLQHELDATRARLDALRIEGDVPRAAQKIRRNTGGAPA